MKSVRARVKLQGSPTELNPMTRMYFILSVIYIYIELHVKIVYQIKHKPLKVKKTFHGLRVLKQTESPLPAEHGPAQSLVLGATGSRETCAIIFPA